MSSKDKPKRPMKSALRPRKRNLFVFSMIEWPGNNLRRLILIPSMSRRERASRIFRSSCNKLRPRMREKWLFKERNMRTLSKLRRISSTDWRMKSKSSRMRMNTSMKLSQLVSQEQEKKLNSGKSNTMRLTDNILSFRLSLRRTKLFG